MKNRREVNYFVHVVYVSLISLLCFNLCQAEKGGSAKREELQRQRLSILEDVFQIMTKAYEKGELSQFSEVRNAHLSVLNARLDLAKSPDERAKIVDEMISVSEKYEATIAQLVTTSPVFSADVLRAKALVVEYQILRERLTE